MRICLSLFSFFLSFLSLPYFSLTVRLCFLSSFFLVFLSVFVLVWLRFVFPSVFFLFIHTCPSDYRSLHSSTHIYAYTYAYILSVYSAESIFPSFSFLHKFYCNPRSILVYGTSVIIPASAARCISY